MFWLEIGDTLWEPGQGVSPVVISNLKRFGRLTESHCSSAIPQCKDACSRQRNDQNKLSRSGLRLRRDCRRILGSGWQRRKSCPAHAEGSQRSYSASRGIFPLGRIASSEWRGFAGISGCWSSWYTSAGRYTWNMLASHLRPWLPPW